MNEPKIVSPDKTEWNGEDYDAQAQLKKDIEKAARKKQQGQMALEL